MKNLFFTLTIAFLAACSGNNDEDAFLASDAENSDITEQDTENAICGDGIINLAIEACDENDFGDITCESLNLPSGELQCSTICTIDTSGCLGTLLCGNGSIDEQEACDGIEFGQQTCQTLGYSFGELTCSATCELNTNECSTVSRCGDGEVFSPEECDDGNNEDNDGCAQDCIWERCGDAIVQTNEECENTRLSLCDNGNTGIQICENCELQPIDCGEDATCGNGLIEIGESCDDGNLNNNDACDNSCQTQTCGNGIREDSEACDAEDVNSLQCSDFGFQLGNITCEACQLKLTECYFPHCGDGSIEGSEECDDGNQQSHDGCSRRCQIEPCDGQPGVLAWPDQDGDGFGDNNITGEVFCEVPEGMVDHEGDCEDQNAEINPNAIEYCDGIDNNCLGLDLNAVDMNTYYYDEDNDGYGFSHTAINACSKPDGSAEIAGDCNDTDATIHPNAQELCNGIDNDCDEIIDGPNPTGRNLTTKYRDLDQDGHGDPENPRIFCLENPHEGYVTLGDDCDDSRPLVNPEMTEICDPENLDENCNGSADDLDPSVDPTTFFAFYTDDDDDGFGTGEIIVQNCDGGYELSLRSDDCNDHNETINPEVDEICNDNIDNNCNNSADHCLLDPIVTLEEVQTRLIGENAGDLFGRELTILDFNGDENMDLAVIAPGADEDRAALYVFFGPLSGEYYAENANIIISPLSEGPLVDRTNISIENAGPITQNEFDDLWIGLPESDKAILFSFNGEETIAQDIFLPQSWIGSAFQNAIFQEEGFVTLIGAAETNSVFLFNNEDLTRLNRAIEMEGQSSFGSSIAVGTNASINHIAIGERNGGRNGGGAIHIYREMNWNRTIDGLEVDSLAGNDIISLGDLDEDHIDDWLVSAPASTVNDIPMIGQVFILYGEADYGENLNEQTSINGIVPDGFFGGCIASVGDFNQDGERNEQMDLLIGAPTASNDGHQSTGQAYLFYGENNSWHDNAAEANVVFNTNSNSLAGWACDGGKDLTGDLIPDLVISAPHSSVTENNQGVVYFFQGSGM